MWPQPYCYPTVEVVSSWGTTYEWTAPEPDGPLLLPLTKLVSLIAATPTFRVRCGLEADDDVGGTALITGVGGTKRLFYPVLDITSVLDAEIFPSIVVQLGPKWEWSVKASGHRNFLRASGVLRMIVLDVDRYPSTENTDNTERSLRDFANYIGNLFKDLATAFGLNDELTANMIRQDESVDENGNRVDTGPRFCPAKEERSRGTGYWHAAYLIDWDG